VEWCGRNFRAYFRFMSVGVKGLHFIKGRKKAAVPAAPDSCVSFCADNPPAVAPHIGSQPATGRMAAKVYGSNRGFPLGCKSFLRAARYFYERIVDSGPCPFRFGSPPFDARRSNRAGQTLNSAFRNRRSGSILWDLSGTGAFDGTWIFRRRPRDFCKPRSLCGFSRNDLAFAGRLAMETGR